MKKDNYFTIENRAAKTVEWQDILSNYYSKNKNFQFNIENSALLIIDMQEYFLNPSSHAYLPAAEAIFDPIIKLQQAFEQRENPVFFTRYGLDPEKNKTNIMDRWWKGSLSTEDPLYKISSKFEVKEENVYEKDTYDSFLGTNLAFLLDKMGYTSLVITGVTTHLCCENTARSAFNYGFEVYLPVDCMATYTEELHLNTLKAASHGFGIPITSNEILELIQNG
ncbi:MAG: isochorismatase family cysteine hydrolase [Candidatus Heimdallarchaeota archaeon]